MESQVEAQSIDGQIAELKSKLTGDMMQDMEIKDQIHALEMKKNNVNPNDSCDIDSCDSCGA